LEAQVADGEPCGFTYLIPFLSARCSCSHLFFCLLKDERRSRPQHRYDDRARRHLGCLLLLWACRRVFRKDPQDIGGEEVTATATVDKQTHCDTINSVLAMLCSNYFPSLFYVALFSSQTYLHFKSCLSTVFHACTIYVPLWHHKIHFHVDVACLCSWHSHGGHCHFNVGFQWWLCPPGEPVGAQRAARCLRSFDWLCGLPRRGPSTRLSACVCVDSIIHGNLANSVWVLILVGC